MGQETSPVMHLPDKADSVKDQVKVVEVNVITMRESRDNEGTARQDLYVIADHQDVRGHLEPPLVNLIGRRASFPAPQSETPGPRQEDDPYGKGQRQEGLGAKP